MKKPVALLAAAAASFILVPQAAAGAAAPTPANDPPAALIILDGSSAPPPPFAQSSQPAIIAEPLTESDLAAMRGGETIVVGNQTLNAMTSGNVLNGDYSAGAVSFSDNAFANFGGIGNVAINTGAQVSLQSGMSVVINVGR